MPPSPPQPSNSFNDKRTYIPERVQRIIDQRAGQTGLNPSSPAPTPQPAAPPITPAQPGQPVVSAEPYDFIMNSDQKPGGRPLLAGLDSTLKRAAFAIGGFIVLLILFAVVKGLFTGSSNLTLIVSVAQDQQELIHLTSSSTGTTQQQSLSITSQNFAATANASLTSSQSAIVTYLGNNKLKVKSAQLNLKVSKQLDDQLVNAAAAGTYDQTFQQITKAQLTTYATDLNTAYQKTKGPKGRVLLISDYQQAKLLLTQLNTTAQ